MVGTEQTAVEIALRATVPDGAMGTVSGQMTSVSQPQQIVLDLLALCSEQMLSSHTRPMMRTMVTSLSKALQLVQAPSLELSHLAMVEFSPTRPACHIQITTLDSVSQGGASE